MSAAAACALASENAFVGATVELQHLSVDTHLILNIHASKGGREDLVYVFNGLQDTFTQISTGGVHNITEIAGGDASVPKLNCFIDAGAGPGRNSSATNGAAVQFNVHFNGGVSAGVDDLACAYVNNATHNCIFERVWLPKKGQFVWRPCSWVSTGKVRPYVPSKPYSLSISRTTSPRHGLTGYLT
jgi:hypothetical protein